MRLTGNYIRTPSLIHAVIIKQKYEKTYYFLILTSNLVPPDINLTILMSFAQRHHTNAYEITKPQIF